MLWEGGRKLIDGLQSGTCIMAAQDDSFFAFYLTGKLGRDYDGALFDSQEFASKFEQKLGFSEIPWGMGVARKGSDRLGDALDLISQIFHRDGIYLRLAQANGIKLDFLIEQQSLWQSIKCDSDQGNDNLSCVLPALNTALEPSIMVTKSLAFEKWVNRQLNILNANIPAMLKTAPAWSLLKTGMFNSVLLMIGAVVITVLFAMLFAAALSSHFKILKWPSRLIVLAAQSSPVLLTLVITSTVVLAVFPYSPALLLSAVMLALGLMNGSMAGQAIAETILSSESGKGSTNTRKPYLHSVVLSSTQLMSFVVNAAKGTPIASFVGTPELVSAVTDITAFSSNRVMTYTFLLIFYVVLVAIVVWLCNQITSVIEKRYGVL